MVSGNPAETLVRLLTDRGGFLAGAESCTAGLAADLLAQVGGASACFWGSFVCYTPQAKTAMLGIDRELLARYGPVSEACARAMAAGALEKSGAGAAFSVTGLAGPGGDGSDLPVGTVWIGTALRSGNDRQPVITARRFFFEGGRNEIRQRAAREALEQILNRLQEID
jgi:PncC family amidohydrolase